MDPETQAMILAFIRHMLTTAGGALVASGAVTDTQWQDFVGVVMVLGSVAWSFWQKRKQSKAIALAAGTAAKSVANGATPAAAAAAGAQQAGGSAEAVSAASAHAKEV